MNKNEAKTKVKEALLKAIQEAGNRGFSLSQANCPVDTGFLKSSGAGKPLANGTEIAYTAQYASEVERGVSAGNRHVKAHTRSGHKVKAYDYYTRGQAANPFIEKSLMNAFSTFSKDVEDSLKSSFGGNKVERG